MSDTATVDEINNKQDVNDSKSALENAQSAETKKKPGPKPKIKTEDTKSENVSSNEEKYAETKNEPENRENESEGAAETIVSESGVLEKKEVKKESGEESATSEFVTAHIPHRCPVYRTPSKGGVVLTMASGFVFCEKTSKNGFYKIKYNSFEKGAKIGYVESKYIAFGAKK